MATTKATQMTTPSLHDVDTSVKQLHLMICHYEMEGDQRTKPEEDAIRRLRELTGELVIGVKTLMNGRAKRAPQ